MVRDFKSFEDIHDISDHLLTNYTLVFEQVHSMPGQGVRSMFTFGMWYGYVQGLLMPVAKETIYYAPQTWQRTVRKAFGLERNPTDWRHLAEGLFPSQRHLFQRVKDHNTADAVMIGIAHLLGAVPSTPIIRRSDLQRRCVPTA
jgi:hypothetical protein